MSNTPDSAKLSDIIQSATQEMASRTEAFIQSVEGKPQGADTVSIMLNGKKADLSRENYNLLKAQNDETKTQMKTLADQIKAKLKNKP